MKKYIILILTVALAACNSKQPATEKETATAESNSVVLTETQLKNAGIQTGMPESKNIAQVLKLNGVIDVPPQNMVSISFPLGGYLKSTKLLPGMHVSKGESLAVLEDPQYIQLQQDYLMAKAKLTYTEADYNRQKDLNAAKANSDKTFQQARADYESQKVLLKSLGEKLFLIGINPTTLNEDNLSRSVNIYSPINGFVTAVNVNIGRYVSPTDVLFELVNPEDVHLNLTVFEKDVNKLAIGQQVTAYTNNDGKKHDAEIILVSRNVDANRAAEVHCHFKKYDKQLLPGMFMNAEVNVQSTDALAVPEAAVVRWQNKNYVFTDAGDYNFTLTEVQTGVTDKGYTELLVSDKDAWAGKKIITSNAYAALMKMKNSGE
ncbi:MAG TPA: efflux RND transporter periplasmic adaptor subunit [Chitinophagales bacterium]|nr:efflux RND transporter periplasmic adaptor subunit [Chitinophagales bacterium]